MASATCPAPTRSPPASALCLAVCHFPPDTTRTHTHTHTFSPPTRDATQRCRPSNHPLCRVTAPSPSIPAPINGLLAAVPADFADVAAHSLSGSSP
ncbi:hypothetical protein M431DRAFT_494105 [Trichoderma harzianum CBS 226.95]|uniref:Uncharacterized protein n=1 Tax=Trichoderma harzianum CBS 226.95 TaxID=983964 RepID=A0A2T4AF35_TRIHA|nr:hypothetical protein M431DRAFT_494105 [Trichoderma harzianum CBS 226.95]PTB55666.1 hypothetical protein M431DRAFT_494105 [Trichoderma harzianum CBS 226.95]